MEEVTGQQMRPIQKFQFVNYDMSSNYVFEGEKPGSKGQDHWARVSAKTQARGVKNKKSAWVAGEELKLNGLQVKWCDGTSAAGNLLQMVAIFSSGFSASEMSEKHPS